jgi:flagellar biosynthesis/type III secretory pathway chaperone
MADQLTSMSFDGMNAFLQKIAGAVLDLRTALEANDMDRLPTALDLTNVALDAINQYPGGAEKLKEDIGQFPKDQKQMLMSLLDEASVNHQINGDLIRLAMQRSAAMQSFIAQQAPSATYDSEGGVPGSVGGVLSRKV